MLTVRAVAIAALTVFGWVLWGIAALMVVYFALAWWSGDPAFKLGYLGAFGLAAFVGGLVCRHFAGRIAPDRR